MTSPRLYDRIVQLLCDDGPLTIEQIADAMGIDYRAAANAMRYLRAQAGRVHIDKRQWRPGRPKARFAFGPGEDDLEVIGKPRAYRKSYANGRTVRQPLSTDWKRPTPERENDTVARVKARGALNWWGAL